MKRAADLAGAVGLTAGERLHVGGGGDREQQLVELVARDAGRRGGSIAGGRSR